MKKLIPLFILIFLFGSSFSKIWNYLTVETTYINIDNPEDSIPKIKFDIHIHDPRKEGKKYKSQGNNANEFIVSEIHIVKDDTLGICRLVNTSKTKLTEWDFPNIPEGFEITYPENGTQLPTLTKKDDFTIYIINWGFDSNYIWRHTPQFKEPIIRWMFDETGKQIIFFNFRYTRSSKKKSTVSISFSQPLPLRELDVQLTNINSDTLASNKPSKTKMGKHITRNINQLLTQNRNTFLLLLLIKINSIQER